MQTHRLSLLRLGRQLKRHEVCTLAVPLDGEITFVVPHIPLILLSILNLYLSNSAFLKYRLPEFARNNPSIEVHVSPRPHKHPVIRGYFINGREHTICVRNLEVDQVLRKAEILRDSNGETQKKVKGGRNVQSLNESTRGIWSPFHGAKGADFSG